MVCVFAKSTAQAYPLAVSVAQGANRYSEINIGKQLVHFAAFAKTKEDASRAVTIIKYLAGSKTFQVFCNGSPAKNWWRFQEVLECFLSACKCSDSAAHCHTILENPFDENKASRSFSIQISLEPKPIKPRLIERYSFPCRLLQRGFRFQLGHPSSPRDLIQAAAVSAGCEWCPNFRADDFKKVQTVLITQEGAIVMEKSE